MAVDPVVKVWSRRFKLIVGAAAAASAVIGVGAALIGTYQSLQEAQGAREDGKASYELLVSKVNSMAERLAYVEGVCHARSASIVLADATPPAPKVSAPLPAPVVVAVTTTKDGTPDKPPKPRPARAPRFKVQAYQQLPESLDTLMKSKDAYAE